MVGSRLKPSTDSPSRIQALLQGAAGSPAAPSLRALSQEPGVEALLGELYAKGRAAWPGVTLEEADFLAHLGARFPETERPRELLERTHAAELFLTCACSRADRVALAALERDYLSEVGAVVSRVDPNPAFQDELQQQLRRLLLVAEQGPPKIAEYSGYGELRNWVRATALRAALRHAQRERKEAPLEGEALAALAQPSADPELAYIQELYRDDFKAAFEAALAGLSSRDRNVLRLHVIDGLNIEQIGGIYRTHRSTIARWIAKTREELLEQTRRKLMEKHGFRTSELESLLTLVRSQLDVSLNRLLRESAE